jgi:glutamate formiminotransferase/formiminotetrahydrofolate cyclodeaminase
MEIIECVPNFSEGRNLEIIEQIANSIKTVPEAKLLNVEPDPDYNRTVITFIGSKKGVLEAAIAASLKAGELIDMTKHSGEHPRIGAIDVVPFIPVKNASMSDCIELAEKYAEIVSEKLNIPIYLYEEARRKEHYRLLSDIRKGEYEGLPEKLQDPNWQPDYGKAIFNPKLGATVTGARPFLIAYNINLDTTDIEISKKISEEIRESGKILRDENGKPIKDQNGVTKRTPGKLKAVQAMGVFLDKYNITQVSTNLKNFEITPLHTVFEEVKKLAQSFNVDVKGSEIVGLVPLKAVLMTADFYAKGANLSEQEKVQLVIEKLGLNSLTDFIPKNKIIDYMI